jgi:hypothetical protein
MKKRYRIEIYDDIKSNDLTMYTNKLVDSERLSQIVFSNLRRFSGNVKAFAIDSTTNKKTAAVMFPLETVAIFKSKISA